jgi:signal transduction histidine kinase
VLEDISYDIAKFFCLLLMAIGTFFLFLQLKTKIDRNLLVFAVRNLLISLFCAVDIWVLSRHYSTGWVVTQHVLASFFPPLFVWNIMTISRRVNARVIKALFAAAAAFSALFISGLAPMSPGGGASASPLCKYLFEPYLAGTLVYLLYMHVASLKNTTAREKVMRVLQLCGLAMFYCFAAIVLSHSAIMTAFFKFIGFDKSHYTILGIVGTLSYCMVGMMTLFNKFTAIMSEQRMAHVNLREAYKDLETTKPLRELGQSVAFVNHEIKNYMMVISGYTTLLQRSKTLGGRDRGMVDSIAEVAAKLQDLSLSVLELSKSKAAGDSKEFDLVRMLDSCIDLHFHRQLHKFDLHSNVPQLTVLVNGSPDKLERVFINAFRNSFEAGAHNISVRVFVYNYMAAAVIEDDGAGCDAEQLSNFFTTFFTTKQGSGGSGIGLCVIRSIVEAHGGNVSIYSKNLLGEGERGLSMQIIIPASKRTPFTAAESEVMLVKEGFKDASEIMRILKNLKIIPHIAEKAKDADFASRSSSINLVVLAASQQAAELKVKSANNQSVRIMPIEEAGKRVLLAVDLERDRKDLFTEEYVIRCLCGD